MCVGAVGNDDSQGPDNCATDTPSLHFGQKNNNQLATRVAKTDVGGRQESIENHTETTTGNNVSMQWLTEQGDGW